VGKFSAFTARVHSGSESAPIIAGYFPALAAAEEARHNCADVVPLPAGHASPLPRMCRMLASPRRSGVCARACVGGWNERSRGQAVVV